MWGHHVRSVLSFSPDLITDACQLDISYGHFSTLITTAGDWMLSLVWFFFPSSLHTLVKGRSLSSNQICHQNSLLQLSGGWLPG